MGPGGGANATVAWARWRRANNWFWLSGLVSGRPALGELAAHRIDMWRIECSGAGLGCARASQRLSGLLRRAPGAGWARTRHIGRPAGRRSLIVAGPGDVSVRARVTPAGHTDGRALNK